MGVGKPLREGQEASGILRPSRGPQGEASRGALVAPKRGGNPGRHRPSPGVPSSPGTCFQPNLGRFAASGSPHPILSFSKLSSTQGGKTVKKNCPPPPATEKELLETRWHPTLQPRAAAAALSWPPEAARPGQGDRTAGLGTVCGPPPPPPLLTVVTTLVTSGAIRPSP